MRSLIICCSALLVVTGCSTTESIQAASSDAAVVPVATSFVAYGSARNSMQQGAISVGAPLGWYSEEVSAAELKEIAVMNNHKFASPWEYMGTRDGYHYLVVYPFIDFRRIYRIKETAYSIDDAFELTGRSSKWRKISVYPDEWVAQFGENMQIEFRDDGGEGAFGDLMIFELDEDVGGEAGAATYQFFPEGGDVYPQVIHLAPPN